MPYRFLTDETVTEGLHRIADEQIDRALEELEEPGLDRHETVHQVRKRCKKIRGLLRLVRPALEPGDEVDDTYSFENAHYRDAAGRLSSIRDATAILETFDLLVDHYGQALDEGVFDDLRQRLEERRQRAVEAANVEERLQWFRRQMLEGRQRVGSWSLAEEGFDALAGGLAKTYRRARKRMADAYDEQTSEAFHEWRKRGKYHWYHCRLLEELWPRMMVERADAAHDLSNLLGDDHDLAVFRGVLEADDEGLDLDDEVRGSLLALLERRRRELEAAARPLGQRLFTESPKRLTRRFEGYWGAGEVSKDSAIRT